VIIPNASFDVLRSDDPPPMDDYSYETDDPIELSAVVEGLPGYRATTTQLPKNAASAAHVDSIKVQFRPGVFDFRRSDRLRDRATGEVLVIDSVVVRRGIGGGAIRLACRHVS